MSFGPPAAIHCIDVKWAVEPLKKGVEAGMAPPLSERVTAAEQSSLNKMDNTRCFIKSVLVGFAVFSAQAGYAFDAKDSPLAAMTTLHAANCATFPQDCLYFVAGERVARARACIVEQSKREVAAALPAVATSGASGAGAGVQTSSEKTLRSKGFYALQARLKPLIADPAVRDAVFASVNPLRAKIQSDIAERLRVLTAIELKTQCNQVLLLTKTVADIMASSTLTPQAGIRQPAVVPLAPPRPPNPR